MNAFATTPSVSTNSDVWTAEEVTALESLITRFTGTNRRIAWGKMEAYLRANPYPFAPSHISKERLRSKYKNMQRANGISAPKDGIIDDE
jgi:hypothetical protein